MRSCEFYERYFRFIAHTRHGGVVFLRDEQDGLDLALAPAEAPEPLPSWFHFGFRLDSPEHVRALHQRMKGEGVTITGGLADERDGIYFRCADPDGYEIEVYWE
jgi:catechol 2,3-dioxygenase-like lactoylglutathione lyase family enzyme